MGWPGYFSFAGTEVLNASRVEAYAAHNNLSWFKPVYRNDDLAWLVGDHPYSTPLQDDAPWTDPDDLNSYDFYGVYPLDITGIESSTVAANVTESVVDGGYIGRVRRNTRAVVFTAVLVGASECAVEYGMRWLRAVLNGGPCFTQNYGSCGGADLCYLACAPAVGEVEPTYTPGPLVLDATNLTANPSLESSLNGWGSITPAAYLLERDTFPPALRDTALSGTASARATRQVASPDTYVAQTYVTDGASGFATAPGQTYTFSMDVRAEDARRISTYVSWYTIAGTLLSSTTPVVKVASTVAEMIHRVDGTATAPANAAFARGVVQVQMTAPATGANKLTHNASFEETPLVGTVSNATAVQDSTWAAPLAGTKSLKLTPTGASYDTNWRPGPAPDAAGSSLAWLGLEKGKTYTVSATFRQTAAQVGDTALRARNLMPSPWETAPVGQAAVKWQSYSSTSGATSITTAADVNEATNPSVAVIGGWAANNITLYPVTLDTTAPISGAGSAMTTRTTTSPSTVVGSIYTSGTTVTGTTQFPATSGIPVTWSMDVRAEQASRQARLDIQWRDAAGASITPPANGNLVALGAPGTVTRMAMTATPPVGAAFCYASIQVITVSGNALDGERAWFDNLRISYTGQTDYFDGSTPGCSWEGAANASRSLKAVTRNGRPALRVQALGTPWPAQPNLMTAGANGTFEGGVLTGWVAFGGTGNAIAAESTIKRTGTGSMKLTWAANATQTGAVTSPAISGFVVGQAYVVEAWVYVPAGSAVSPQLRVTGSPSSLTVSAGMAVKDTWTLVTQSFVPATTSYQFAFYSTAVTVGGEVAYLDDVKIYAQQNLLAQGENGTFELGSVSGWSAAGTVPPGIGSATTRPRNGSYSMRITWPASTAGQSYALATVPTVIGVQYTVEAWLYCPTGSPNAAAWFGTVAGNTVTTKDAWTLSTVTFVATATTTELRVDNRTTGTAGTLCYVDDVQVYRSTVTNRLGMRSIQAANNPAIPAGTKVLITCEVYVSSVGGPPPSTISVILRDDVNNDSAAATLDPSTPSGPSFGGAGNLDKWVRFEWLATVNPGRTITGIYISPSYVQNVSAGGYVDYSAMLVQPDAALGAPYFDGDTVDWVATSYNWVGAVGASVSEQRGPGLWNQARSIRVAQRNVAGVDASIIYSNIAPNAAGEARVKATFAVPGDCQDIYLNLIDGSSLPADVAWWDALLIEDGTTAGIWAAAPAGERAWFDNLRVGVDDTRTDYFDGGTPDDDNFDYGWIGVANASPSQRYAKTQIQDPVPTAQDCYDRVGRSLHEVTTTTGPAVTQKMTMSDGGTAWAVTWTMVAANPAEFGVERPLIFGFLDPSVEIPYVGGVVPPGGSFDPDGHIDTDEPCPLPAFRPVFDPTCDLLTPPPDVPTVVPMCFTFPVNYVRRSFTIPGEDIPLWTEIAPVVTLHTSGTEARSVRLRFYADTFGTGSPDSDPCNFCGDVVFSYIPAFSTLVLDCADRIVYIDSPGQPRRRADTLVSDSSGNPFEWPQFSCGFGYMVTVDTPQQGSAVPAIDLALVPRVA